MPRKDRNATRRDQDRYIEHHVACGGQKTAAAKKAGLEIRNVFRWFQKDEEFRARVKEAEDQLYEKLVAAGLKRAMEKSDTLTIFFLKARYPDIYDDNIRQKRFLDEIVSKVKDSLPVIQLEPEEKLEKPVK